MTSINLALKQKCDLPKGPSAWESFLLGTGVAEKSCTTLIAGRTRKGRVIRAWVRDHYATKYVPENILEALGLRKQLVVRWQGED
jgi:hypothetical protein